MYGCVDRPVVNSFEPGEQRFGSDSNSRTPAPAGPDKELVRAVFLSGCGWRIKGFETPHAPSLGRTRRNHQAVAEAEEEEEEKRGLSLSILPHGNGTRLLPSSLASDSGVGNPSSVFLLPPFRGRFGFGFFFLVGLSGWAS